jgi:hypothetical protein
MTLLVIGVKLSVSGKDYSSTYVLEWVLRVAQEYEELVRKQI